MAYALIGASLGGAATTAAWSILSGGGTLSSTAQTNNPAAVTYTPAANFSGIAKLLLTSNDPDGAGPCVAATVTRIVNVNALPTITTLNSNTFNNLPGSYQ